MKPNADDPTRDSGSFRDPSGFIYRRDGVLYRQVARSFADRWDDLAASGLLESMQTRGMLVQHTLAAPGAAFDRERAHVVIQPEPVEFISYPYEWSFGELKDAALLTLEAQQMATTAGFTLRDATAFNVQFQRGRPILIDTLSFERATPGAPWVAYRQFCEQFLAPLALMAKRDIRCGMLLRDYIDGIPLDLAARLLPGRTRLSLGLGSHIHAHARAQLRYEGRTDVADVRTRPALSPLKQAAFLDSLRRTIDSLDWRPTGTEWADYADHTSYGEAAASDKDAVVHRFVEAAGGRVVWDLGANAGRYSRIAASLGRRVVAWDVDPAATEMHYRAVRRDAVTSILPLLGDLVNPSPALGWAHAERRSLRDRADADVVLALALVHHLAIGRNIPLRHLAAFLAELGPHLVIEFVPREDSRVQRLLATREDVFADYTSDGFREAFLAQYDIRGEAPIKGTARTIFWFARRG